MSKYFSMQGRWSLLKCKQLLIASTFPLFLDDHCLDIKATTQRLTLELQLSSLLLLLGSCFFFMQKIFSFLIYASLVKNKLIFFVIVPLYRFSLLDFNFTIVNIEIVRYVIIILHFQGLATHRSTLRCLDLTKMERCLNMDTCFCEKYI